MKQTHKIAYNYCMAMISQRYGEDQVCKALYSLGTDNLVFGLAEPIEGAYTTLVQELIGPELFEWLMWWMYETDYGESNLSLFTIDGIEYDPSQMTLQQFLEVVDQ